MNFLERIAGLSPKRLALLAAQLNTRLEHLEQRTAEPIAVIGLGCRFPGGANDPDSFWRLLIEGRDAIEEVPAHRWDLDALYDPDPDATGKMNTRWGGFLDGIDQFDPEFFGISPREAASMDPQQRVLLEVTWEALENAGLCPDRLAGSRTGVFVGLCNGDYLLKQFETGRESMDAYVATGNAHSVASGRISYLLGLQGPSLSVDTGCSASLVAVHLACQSLKAGECRVALAGGVNLILMPDTTIVLSKAHMMSPNGRCKAFDASADGFVRSEGCGIIVLKRLSDARADGDQILAVIRGTASNQDGRSNGLTAPNGPSQVAVIREALANAGLEPDDVDYIEAHGTGTSLGDPIEAHALAEVFGPGRTPDCPLRIGSVKTNFGHAESAAGIAGLIKAILAIGHEIIPPSLHFQKLNPHIDWSDLPFSVPNSVTPWTRTHGQRVAGVSSFGFSGTNVHVVLSEIPVKDTPPESSAQNSPDRALSPQLLLLSARSESGLLELAERYQRFFSERPNLQLADVCSTANAGRSHFEHRLAIIAETLPEASEGLASFRSGQKSDGIRSARSTKSVAPGVVFMFTGQGSQYPGMGRALFDTQPVFRRELEKCGEILDPLLDFPLLETLFPDKNEFHHRVNETQYTQPALFALEYALAVLWRSWGVEPAAVLGHSVGEYAAACVAGVFSLEDGLRLIAARGRLMGSLPPGGAMAAVFADESRVLRAIQAQGNRVAVACINGPTSIVVSGHSVAVDQLLSELKNAGVQSRSLVVSHAFHSELMDPILDSFYQVAASIQYSQPSLPIVSNVTGLVADPSLMSAPEYWRRQIRNPVRFADSIRTLRESGHSVFLEIGPQPILTGMARATAPDPELVWACSLNRNKQDFETLLEAVAVLYTEGANLQWSSLPTPFASKRLALPTYPFQRSRFWIRENGLPQQRKKTHSRGATSHPLLAERLDSPAIAGTVFETNLDADRPAFLNDHRIFGRLMLPSPAYIEMALAGAGQLAQLGPADSFPLEVTNLLIHEPLFLPENGSCKVQVILEDAVERSMSFRICSRDLPDPAEKAFEVSWRTHASGRVRIGAAAPAKTQVWEQSSVRRRCRDELDPGSFYETLIPLGLEFGERFRGITSIRRRDGEALAENRLPDSLSNENGLYRFHPALLDSCFHLLGAALPAGDVNCGYLLIGLERFTLFSSSPSRLWNHAVLGSPSVPTKETFTANIWLYDDQDRLVAEILGVQLKRAPREAITRGVESEDENWFYRLEWRSQAVSVVKSKGREISDLEDAAPALGREPALIGNKGITKAPPGCWIILADNQGIAEHLADLVSERGQESVLVSQAKEYQFRPEVPATLDPLQAADFRHLFLDATAHGKGPVKGVVDLWPLNEELGPETEPVEWKAAQERIGGGTLNVTRAFLESDSLSENARLWFATSGAQYATSKGRLSGGLCQPIQAITWGLGRVISLEHPDRFGALIDLDPEASPRESAAALLREIDQGDEEDAVAYRKSERLVPRLVRAEQPPSEPRSFRRDGSYLITGGLGGLGLRVAEWMAANGAGQVVLLSRREFPDRALWPCLPPGDPSRQSVDTITRAEKLGTKVTVAQADVADENAMRVVLARFAAEGSPLRGIVHCATEVTSRSISDLDLSAFQQVCHAKAVGAWVLNRLTLRTELDFFVLFSSIASVWGAAGLGHYAAANQVLDALAHWRRERGLTALSVNWGSWEEMRLASETDKQEFERAGLHPMPNDRALAALGRLISNDRASAVVASVEWDRLRGVYQARRRRPLFSDILPRARKRSALSEKKLVTPESNFAFKLQSAPIARRRALLIAHLRFLAANVLGFDPSREIDLERGLFELGMDSIMSIEFKRRLEQTLDLELPSTLTFNYPNIKALTGYILYDVLKLPSESDAEMSAPREDPAKNPLSSQPVDELSQDEIAHLLLKKLEEIK